MSRKLILKMSMSLDGFVCGPNGELDWMNASRSPSGATWTIERLGEASLHIMGQRAYHEMARFWATSSMPMATPMNTIPKMIFSRSGVVTPPEDLTALESQRTDAIDGWLRPGVGGADLIGELTRLKEEDGLPILAHGGASFGQSLVASGLIDEYCLVIHPVVIGQGRALFGLIEEPKQFELVSEASFEKGTIARIFRPAAKG